MDRAHTLYTPALRYFAAVAKHGSIRAAARDLNIASSAVNRQVLWLEEALGVQVFDRIGRQLKLSAAGSILLGHIEETLTGFEAAVEEIEALRGLRRGSVRIATVESVSEALLPDIIGGFRKDYPDIRLEITVGSAARVANLVEAADADIGITFNPKASALLDVTKHLEVTLGAVVSAGHPLAKNQTVRLAECMDYPLAFPGRGLAVRGSLDKALAAAGFTPRPFVEANSLRLLKSLVRETGCVGFQTQIGLERDLDNEELVFIELGDPGIPSDTLAVICRSGRALKLAPAAFYDHLVLRLAPDTDLK